MKKITLLFCFLFVYSMHAQVTIWSDDFNDEDISDWTTTDTDGDGINWGEISAVGDGMGGFVTPLSLISRSWQGSALTPDNWVVSPAIDLSDANAPISLNWITQVAAQAWDEEKYSVYVGTTNDISILVNSATSMTETLGDAGDTGTPLDHAFDISAFAGEAVVYIAFRHWDCTDQDFLSVDDVTVEAQSLSIDEFSQPEFSQISSIDRIVTISNIQGEARFRILSLTGQEIIKGSTKLESQIINTENLTSGVYIVEVSDTKSNSIKRKKVVIQ